MINRSHQMSKPPNIVLIMADQLAPQFTGAYGHSVVKTPHMDALAAEGARFDSAYCNSPLCAPSRASFMTGQLPNRIASYDNSSELPASLPTFAHYLRTMGYRTCLSGKMHFVGPDQLHGFDERLTTDIYPADFAWTPNWERPDENITKWFHNMDAVRQAGIAATTFQYEYDEEAAFFARRRIYEFAMDRTLPFALTVSFIHPHDPYVTRPEWWNLYDHASIDLPATGLADDPCSRRLAKGIGAEAEAVSEEHIRLARHAYYANTSYFDSQVGKIVQTLREADLLDSTIVMVTADHGDMLGERGLWYKMNHFEHSARVPLIIHGPGIERGEISEPVSLVDLLPTFLDIAASEGRQMPGLGMTVDGRSIWPLATGQPDPGREVLSEYCAEIASHPMLMIRRGAYKFIHCDSDPPLLYNVLLDPMERTNLAVDPEHSDLAESFAAEVARRWDTGTLRERVITSQKLRHAVHTALETGLRPSWDYNPPRDASQEFVRNTVSWDDVLSRMQYPAPVNEQ